MDVPRILKSQELCHKSVVVRWNPDENNFNIIEHVASFGYEVTLKNVCIGRNDSDPFYVFLLESEDEGRRLCLDSNIQNSGIRINPLIGLNGLRLRDINDILKVMSIDRKMDDHELMELMINLICHEVPEREKKALEEVKIIKNGIGEIIENGVCTVFGSYSSPFRRNGYSDIDLSVSSDSGRTKIIRPLQEIIDNPKCLLVNPLTTSEFYSYPDEEIIKAIYECLVDREIFQKNFTMRTLLVRTPIVIFTSKNVPEMKMSYDVSVNNEISVEKSRILNDFISKDDSIGNKMRNVTMFIIHWLKSKKILGGVYPGEKLETKWKFNSYIINQWIIHFVQMKSGKLLINVLEKPENRVASYNFDDLFIGYFDFLHEFCSYFLNFKFEEFGIFGNEVVEKSKLAEIEGVSMSPLMMIDPLDTTHNVSEKVIPDGLILFKKLMKSSLTKMKQNEFRITDLL